MGHMHSPGKGLSQSALPYCHSIPTWLKLTSGDVKDNYFKIWTLVLSTQRTMECVFPLVLDITLS
uniref:Small ribosomal subunit protein uS15 N-terminal domain-containing protein n=1 Tax=Catagonus wagneri TaxID=51154 RepID=A0A8C3YDZ8_9CETA